MYKKVDVTSIDGFDSSSPQASDRAEQKTPAELLLDSMEALKVSVEAAKTPFARASKLVLSEYLETGKGHMGHLPHEVRKGTAENLLLGEDLIFTAHHTITLRCIPVDPAYHRRLFTELVWFCDDARRGAEGQTMTILDGLQVDIRKVGEEHFTFSWKLRYAVHHG